MAFDQGATAGTTLVQASIHSPDYAKGSSGWTINRDGSAEFQNVLVRGTITGSTIIGSTIIGGTITGGVFVSQNWVSNTTGFAMNGTSSPFTNSGGTIAANSTEFNSTISIGQNLATNNHILLARNSSANQSAIEYFSGLAGETQPAAMLATFSGTQPVLGVQSATVSNGQVGAQLWTPTTTHNAQFTIGTASSTAPAGQTTGQMLVGESASDTWQLAISNENSVSGGLHGLTIGNTFSPQSRMFISSNEIKTVDGFGAIETLYLNEDNGEVVSGSVLSAAMRTVGGVDINTYNVNSATYSNPTTVSVQVFAPASGTVLVFLTVVVAATTGKGSAQFGVGSIKVVESPSGTTLFTPSDNRGVQFQMNDAAGDSYTLTGVILVSGATLGQLLTITPQFRTTVAADVFQVQRTTITVLPSF